MAIPRCLAWAVVLACTALVPPAAPAADEHPVAPYVDPSQLDVPWPKHSYYKQPWRGFLETRSGAEFVQGIGINYNVPRNDELAVRLLAETGFRTFRIEIGWGSVKWDESGINNHDRYLKLLRLCKQYHARPTMLMNAHHGMPCPARLFERKLAEDAAAGSRSIRLADTSDVAVAYTGPMDSVTHTTPGAFITSANRETGECQLSRPLPAALSKDKPVRLATLKYQPLCPIDTKEFGETAGGWVKYARTIAALVREAGIEEFDLELWNELSFGSNYVDVNRYYDPPRFDRKKVPDFLHPGGSAWEMSSRTIEAVRKEYPKARFVWGWSNTTFYHCPVDQLPPGTDGQSYHPYGTGVRRLPAEEPHKDHPEFNLEGFIPHAEFRTPEGWAHEFIKTEGLMRLLNPNDRAKHPPGVDRFRHYMTEHGVAPPETGVTDEAGAWRVKSMCAVRSFCLWLNKGVDVMHYFCAFDRKADGMGLLPPDLEKLPADAKWDDVATPPMRAVRDLVRAFEGAAAVEKPVPLQVEVTELGEPRKVFEGDEKHPPLWQREAFAVLPWQVAKGRFVIAAYAMTYDVTKPWAEQTYRVRIKGLSVKPGTVRCYDPMTDKDVPVVVRAAGDDGVEVEMLAMDYPRLITLAP